MNAPRIILLTIFVELLCSRTHAADLEVSLRTYPTDRVLFADPLYLEITIVNKGREIITAPRPIIDLGTLEPRLREPGSQIEMICADEVSGPNIGTGPGKPVEFLPGKSVKLYTCIFLPRGLQLNHPFWKEARDTTSFHIWAVYWQSPNIALFSNRCRIEVFGRDDEEMRVLEQWAGFDNQEQGDTPIWPSDLSVEVGVHSRADAREVANKVNSGELGELLRLAVRLQDLYATPADARDKLTKELVEYLKSLPDIKRQAVTNAARVPILGCISAETAKELQSIAEVDY